MKKAQDLKNLINNSSEILLVLPNIVNADVSVSLILTYQLLTEKFNKNVTIASSHALPERFTELVDKAGIDREKIESQIKPISYVIKVADVDKEVKLDYTTTGNDLNIVLTPEGKEVNFDKISFSKEGGLFDLVFVFNTAQLEDLGEIYISSKKQFDAYELVNISNREKNAEGVRITLSDKKVTTTTELVYNLYQELELELSKEQAALVLEGIVGSTYGLHQIRSAGTLRLVADLSEKYELNIGEPIAKYFYSFEGKDLKFREKLLRNVKIDAENKIIYSYLLATDFSELGLTPAYLDGVDYLPFNICKGMEVAFLAYTEANTTKILIYSEDSEKITNLVSEYKGVGSKKVGLLTFSEELNFAISNLLNKLTGKSNANETLPVAPSPAPTIPDPAQSNSAIPAPVFNNEPEKVAPVAEENVNVAPTSAPISEPEKPAVVEPTPQAPVTPVGVSPFSKASAPVVDSNAPTPTATSGYGFKPFQKAS